MADLRIITLLPTQTVSGVQQSNLSPGVGSQGTTPSIANLPVGSTLVGFIVNRDATGNPILRTDNGDIAFQSNLFLKIGSEVVIRIENIGHNTLAHILSVDGEAPEIAAAKPIFSLPEDVIVGKNFTAPATAARTEPTPATTAAAPPPQTTVTLKGTLIGPPPQPVAATSAPLPAPLATGTQLTLKIVTLNAPVSTIHQDILAALAPAERPAPPTPASPVSYAAYTRASGIPPLPETIPVVGQPAAPTPIRQETTAQTAPPLPANISQLLPQTPPAPATTVSAAPPQAPAAPVQSLPAVVISSDPGSESIVQTPLGVVRLQTATPLPVGSKLVFEIAQTLPPTAAAAVSSAAIQTPAPLVELAQHWQALQHIFTLLSSPQAPAGMDSFLNILPALSTQPSAGQSFIPPQNISAGLMLFVTALRGGDFSNWVGKENIRWLEDQGHGTLVKKAEGEFLGMARQYGETAPHHWQPVFFPLAVDGMLQQVRLFVKRDRKSGGNPQDRKKEDTRFVVEVDLTQLGEIQLDGFVRRGQAEVQFDLVIRSLAPLSPEMQQNIAQIYNDTGLITGYAGSLIFQPVKDFPVNPMEDIVAHAMNRVTV